jgi:hypothetical protein
VIEDVEDGIGVGGRGGEGLAVRRLRATVTGVPGVATKAGPSVAISGTRYWQW